MGTGRQSLQGLKLCAEVAPQGGKPGMVLVTPRDILENRAGGCIRIIGSDDAAPQAQLDGPSTSPATTAAHGGTLPAKASAGGYRGIGGVAGRMSPQAARDAAVPQGRRTGAFQKKGGSTLQFVRLMQLDRDPAGLQGASPSRKVSMAEVTRHASKADAWTVLDGRVFNITPYMEYHPGGVAELMRSAGCNGTALFREVHPWVSVDMIDRLQVGVLDCSIPAHPVATEHALHPEEWRSFPLMGIQRMTPDTLLLRFAFQDTRQKSGLRSGQHLKVRMKMKQGSEVVYVERPYTPTSASDAAGFVELLVKVYRSGRMGPALAALKSRSDNAEGDCVEMQGPFGDLVYLGGSRFDLGTAGPSSRRSESPARVIMLAAGSGVTPMLQLLRAMTVEWLSGQCPKTCKTTLIFCNRREEDIILRQGLERLASDEPGRFNLCLVLSCPPIDSASWSGVALSDTCGTLPQKVNGHISDDLIACAFESADDTFQDVLVLCCGPEGFNETVSGALKRLCVPADRLHTF